MNERLPALTAREVIHALERAGFVVSRTSGSHCRLIHMTDRSGMQGDGAGPQRRSQARHNARHHRTSGHDGSGIPFIPIGIDQTPE
jgi:hypothetical protein